MPGFQQEQVDKNQERLKDLLFQAGEAIRLTREYVGEDLLPPLEGWSWFDAYCAIAAELDIDGMHQNVGKWVDDYQRRQRELSDKTFKSNVS